jgi:hypothetical protein
MFTIAPQSLFHTDIFTMVAIKPANELVAPWLVLAAASQPTPVRTLRRRSVVSHFRKKTLHVSYVLRSAQFALSQVTVPLCKDETGVKRFSRPVREYILS